MNDLKQELLTKFDFFNNLPIKKSEVIIDKLELKEYTAGKVIFEKGSEKNAGIFFLIDGVVNFLKESSQDVFIDFLLNLAIDTSKKLTICIYKNQIYKRVMLYISI